MALRPAVPTLRLPRTGEGRFDSAMLQLEREDARNAKQGTTPSFPSVLLTASDGSTWRLSVSPTGVLSTAVVSRT